MIDHVRMALLWLALKVLAFLRALWTLDTLNLLARIALVAAGAPLVRRGILTGGDVEAVIGVVLLALGAAWTKQVEAKKLQTIPPGLCCQNCGHDHAKEGIGTVPVKAGEGG